MEKYSQEADELGRPQEWENIHSKQMSLGGHMPIVCLDPIDVQGTGRPDGYARMDALPTAL